MRGANPRKMSEHDPDSVLGGMTDGLLILMNENRALREQRNALAAALAEAADGLECECELLSEGFECRKCCALAALRAIAPAEAS